MCGCLYISYASTELLKSPIVGESASNYTVPFQIPSSREEKMREELF